MPPQNDATTLAQDVVTALRDLQSNLPPGTASTLVDYTLARATNMLEATAILSTEAAEARHALKNAYAIACEIAEQEHAASNQTEGFGDRMRTRLDAQGRTADLKKLIGPNGRDVRGLTLEILRTFSDEQEQRRVVAAGPQLVLRPDYAFALATAITELGRNALKHGALSVSDGKLRIGWHQTGPNMLNLLWQEREGPTIEKSPVAGTGLTLLERDLKVRFGATLTPEWNRDGLTARLHLPLTQAWREQERQTAPKAQILVVEDDETCADRLQDIVEEAGMSVLVRTGTVETAMTAIDEGSVFDAAILDYQLSHETVEALAYRLAGMGIPMIFTSGNENLDVRPYGRATAVPKPYSSQAIIAAVQAMIASWPADIGVGSDITRMAIG